MNMYNVHKYTIRESSPKNVAIICMKENLESCRSNKMKFKIFYFLSHPRLGCNHLFFKARQRYWLNMACASKLGCNWFFFALQRFWLNMAHTSLIVFVLFASTAKVLTKHGTPPRLGCNCFFFLSTAKILTKMACTPKVWVYLVFF